MDKLKPILAQKFWILFGLVLILPAVGYFMTKGELAAEIESRWKTLDDTFKGIPTGQDSPNEQWANEAKAINQQRKLQNSVANKALWEAQKQRMRWPDGIAAAMQKAEYFKPLAAEQGANNVRYKFQQNYPNELRRLWEIVDPYEDGKNLRDSNVRRKVTFAMDDLHQVIQSRWLDFPPEFDEIWACQEDIWLQTELLNAIARVNANALTQADAPIKVIGKILLFGGAKSTGDVTSGPGSGGMPGAGVDPGMVPGGGFMPGMGAGVGGGSGGARRQEAIPADINIAEEFTISADPTVAAGGGAGAGGGTATFGAIGVDASAASSGPGTGAGSPGGGTKPDVKRYIDDVEGQPFKRRGFSFKVVMDHMKVPDLLAELSNSPYPVEIIRVQQTWFADPGASGGGGAMPSFAGSGVGGPSGPGFPGFAPPIAPGNEASVDVAPASTEFAGAGVGGGSYAGAGTPGRSGSGAQVAMADPRLAHVTILGVWTLYRPPVIDPNAPAASGAATTPELAAPAAAPVVAPTANTPPAAAPNSANEPTTEPKADGEPAAPNTTPNPDPKAPAVPAAAPNEKPATETATSPKPAAEPPPSEPKADQ